MEGEAVERVLFKTIDILLAKKSHYVSQTDLGRLTWFLDISASEGSLVVLRIAVKDLVDDITSKIRHNQRPNAKVRALRDIKEKLSSKARFDEKLLRSRVFVPDKEETEIVSERVPRVDVYEGSKSEILRIVQTLVPVIIMSREGSVIDKKGRIVLGAERGALTGEILDLAAECSDCIVMDLAMASQVENLAILKRKRCKFRYVILYGERDKDAATRVSCALMA